MMIALELVEIDDAIVDRAGVDVLTKRLKGKC